MRCYECSGTFVEHTGSLLFHDKIVGEYTVDKISYRKCDSCGEYAFPAGVSTVIEEVKKERLECLIGNLPLDEFITAPEVASILGISRQAVNKHRRISRGFIHSKRHGDRMLYSKKSVALFKNTGDGRFNLSQQTAQEVVKYLLIPASTSPNHDLYIDSIEEHQELTWGKEEILTANHVSSHYTQ